MNRGSKRPLDRVVRRPYISEHCYALEANETIDAFSPAIAMCTANARTNRLNKRLNRLNRIDYWEVDHGTIDA